MPSLVAEQILRPSSTSFELLDASLRGEVQTRLNLLTLLQIQKSDGSFVEAREDPSEYDPQLQGSIAQLESTKAAITDVLVEAQVSVRESDPACTEIPAEDLFRVAQENVIKKAYETKDGGNHEDAIEAVRLSLIIRTAFLAERRSPVDDDTYVESLVANGLGAEVVWAAHQSRDYIRRIPIKGSRYDISEDITRPLAGKHNLLKLSSGLSFDQDFTNPQPLSEDRAELLEDLYVRDFMALSKCACMQGDTEEAQNLLAKAAEVLPSNDYGVTHKDIADLLATVHPEMQPRVSVLLAPIRQAREAGNSNRANKGVCRKLDWSVVSLLEMGQDDIAKALISSRSGDAQQLIDVVALSVQEPEQRIALGAKLHDIHSAKQQELKQALLAVGVTEAVQSTVLKKAVDPDDAANVDPAFWQLYTDLPSELQTLFLSQANLHKAALALTALEQNNILDQSEALIPLCGELAADQQIINYLQSYAKLVATLRDRPALQPDQTAISPEDFAYFTNPYEAYLQAVKIDSGNPLTGSRFLLEYYAPEMGNMIPDAIDDKVVDALAEFNNLRLASGVDLDSACVIATGVGYRHGLDALKNLAPFLDVIVRIRGDKTKFVSALGRVKDLDELSLAIDTVNQTFSGIGQKLYEAIFTEVCIYSVNDSLEKARVFHEVENMLELHGLTIEDMPFKTFQGVVDFWRNTKDTANGVHKFTEYCQSLEVDLSVRRDNKESDFRLDDFPEAQQLFRALELGKTTSKALFTSWSTYKPFAALLYAESHNSDFRVSDVDTDNAGEEMLEKFYEEYHALESFVARYGAAEAKAIIDTFDIHHFSWYPSSFLHYQLISWNSGKIAAQNIIFTGHDNWNNTSGINNTGADSIEQFGRLGLFCFEISDPTEIGKILVKVGNRERQNGRTPRVYNAVKNVVFNSHSSHDGMAFSSHGVLDVDMYQEASVARQKHGYRINNYERHLGNLFRTILAGCEAATEKYDGRNNIKQHIEEGHAVQAIASNRPITGFRLTKGIVEFIAKDRHGRETYFAPV
jgi:tetratricopeptide (TPR) repeat protein